jgi:hypothetical protein
MPSILYAQGIMQTFCVNDLLYRSAECAYSVDQEDSRYLHGESPLLIDRL